MNPARTLPYDDPRRPLGFDFTTDLPLGAEEARRLQERLVRLLADYAPDSTDSSDGTFVFSISFVPIPGRQR